MTITSWGWDGSVDEGKWALMSGLVGTDRVFRGDADFKPRAGTVSPRTVILSAGLALGSGVSVSSDAEITLTHSDVGVGQSRWDAIVIRRDWSGTGGTASVVVVPGTAGSPGAKTLPTLNETPGDVEDQLVAWVQITAGQSQPTAIDDLRLRASPVILAATLSAIRRPRLGQEAVLSDGRRYRYELVSGVAQWRGDRSIFSPLTSTQRTDIMTGAGGWTVTGGVTQELIPLSSNSAWLTFEMTYRGASPITADDDSGNIGDVQIAQLVTPYFPSKPIIAPCDLVCRKGSPTAGELGVSGTIRVGTDGKVYLTAGSPSMDVYLRPLGSASITASLMIVSNSAFNPNA